MHGDSKLIINSLNHLTFLLITLSCDLKGWENIENQYIYMHEGMFDEMKLFKLSHSAKFEASIPAEVYRTKTWLLVSHHLHAFSCLSAFKISTLSNLQGKEATKFGLE